MKFLAEIKTINMRKTSSGDLEYKVILITDKPDVLALGTIGPQELVLISVDKASESEI